MGEGFVEEEMGEGFRPGEGGLARSGIGTEGGSSTREWEHGSG